MEAVRVGKGLPSCSPSRFPPTPSFRATDAFERQRDLTGPLPLELAALREHVPETFLHQMARYARQAGVGGDEALISRGHVTDAEATAAVADHLEVPCVSRIEGLSPPTDPGWRARAEWARGLLRTGVHAGVTAGQRVVFTVAARGRAVRRLARTLRADPQLATRMRLIAPGALRRQVLAVAGEDLACQAAFGLREAAPERSAGAVRTRRILGLLGIVLTVLALGAVLALDFTLLAMQAALSVIFLAWTALRLAGCVFDGRDTRDDAAVTPRPALQERQLPVYTLLVPLYREAESVPRLIAALRALDYPLEKLDIKLVVEADDAQTRSAIARVGLPPQMEEVAVPHIGPRTKPKALNMALALARGTYVAVYDAEDLPESDQLRQALEGFRRGGADIACVQAQLCVDNGSECWISGHFAAEYAVQFDVLLPVLSALRLPILLGGTSNHFRRDVLEAVGGWDPLNVTEDADLGIRLARAGWRTQVIHSATYEEAPVSVRAWLGQRTRWLKGWAQTLLVHGQHPWALWRDLGWGGTLAVAILTLGPFAAALLHPFCMGLLAWNLTTGTWGNPGESWSEVITAALTTVTLAVGYLGTALAMAVGLARRGNRPRAGVLLTIPFYWLLLSLATWRAMIDLVRRPYHWEKTAHGVSRVRRVLGLRAFKNSA